jgi:hypothetical protein
MVRNLKKLKKRDFISEIDSNVFSKKKSDELIQETFRLIETYMKDSSPKQVNIPGSLLRTFMEKISKSKLTIESKVWTLEEDFETLFLPIRSMIFSELSVDSYPRFILSDYYLGVGQHKNEIVDLLPMREIAKRRATGKNLPAFELTNTKNLTILSPRDKVLKSQQNQQQEEIDPTDEEIVFVETSSTSKNSSPVSKSNKVKDKLINMATKRPNSTPESSLSSVGEDYLSDSLKTVDGSFYISSQDDDFDFQTDMTMENFGEEVAEELMKMSLKEVIENELGRRHFENFMKKNSQQSFTALDFLNTHYFFLELCENTNSNDYETCAQLIGEKYIHNENFIKQLLLIELNTSYASVNDSRIVKEIKKISQKLRDKEISSTMFETVAVCVLSFYEIIYHDFSQSLEYLEMEHEIFEKERNKNLKTTTIKGAVSKYLNIKEESDLVELIKKARNKKNGIRGYGVFLYQFKKYDRCWKGKNFGEWLKTNYKLKDSQVLEVGEQLLQECYFHHILDTKQFELNSNIYRFNLDDDSKVLNTHRKFIGVPLSAMIVTQRLQKSLLVLHTKFITDNGVDYAALAKSDEFRDYCNSSIELQSVRNFKNSNVFPDES